MANMSGTPISPSRKTPSPAIPPVVSPRAIVFSTTTTRGETGRRSFGGVAFGLPKMFARHAVGSRSGATAMLTAQAPAKSCWLAWCSVSAFSSSRQPGSFPVLQRSRVIVWRGRPLIGSTLRL